MRIPESHIDIVNEKTRAVLSTINKSEVYSAFCTIRKENEYILLDGVDEEQAQHIQKNQRVSIMAIDPSNIGRWLCILGTLKPNDMVSSFHVNINKIIKFRKD